MSQNERFYRINQLLQDRKVVPRQVFLDELGISLATFKRDLEYLRDRLNAPIEYDREAGGYRFVQAHTGPKFELPGLWFSSSEVHALLTMQHLLEQLEPSLLGAQIAPLLSRLHTMLDTSDVPAEQIGHPKRLVIIEMGAGTAIATIRRLNERILTQQQQLNPSLIRINPTEPDGPAGTISLQTGALNGLQLIQSMCQLE